jgi:hypothetical protein
VNIQTIIRIYLRAAGFYALAETLRMPRNHHSRGSLMLLLCCYLLRRQAIGTMFTPVRTLLFLVYPLARINHIRCLVFCFKCDISKVKYLPALAGVKVGVFFIVSRALNSNKILVQTYLSQSRGLLGY